jgi:hypothetical protein
MNAKVNYSEALPSLSNLYGQAAEFYEPLLDGEALDSP